MRGWITLSLLLALSSNAGSSCSVNELDCRTEDASCDPMALQAVLSGESGLLSSNQGQVIIFASNALHPGDRGNRSITSFSCTSERTTYKPGLSCTNDMAFLSYPGDALVNALGNHGVPAGLPIVSETSTQIETSWAALFDGNIAISLSGAGVATVGTRYWTGTDFDGSTTADHCNSWGDGTAGFNGMAGLRTSTDSTWINTESVTCDNTRHFLCVCW